MEKVFKEAQVKQLLNQVDTEKVSFSRFVEILNTLVTFYMKDPEKSCMTKKKLTEEYILSKESKKLNKVLSGYDLNKVGGFRKK